MKTDRIYKARTFFQAPAGSLTSTSMMWININSVALYDDELKSGKYDSTR